tara:strand:+ start:5373 stop:5849 length:477 start_codon:yes stop_codon:yes gene_type:complete
MSIPQDIQADIDDVAAEKEMMVTDAMMESAPKGQFSAEALNRLVAEVNKLLPKMQMPLYPTFDADITAFPPEFVDVLMGIADVASQAGIESPFDLTAVEDDRDLAMLAGQVGQLVNDEKLLDFISNQGNEEPVAEEVTMEETPEGSVETDDELFLRRM